MGQSILEAALSYLQLGWSLVPQCAPAPGGGCHQHGPRCEKPGKTPLLKWEIFRTYPAKEEKLRAWWGEGGLYAMANLATLTGLCSHLVVLDLDGQEGIEAFGDLAEGRGLGHVDYALAQTPRGGNHLFFSTDKPIPSVPDLLPKVEVKGEGGMATLSPSKGAKGPYTWLIDPQLALEGHAPRQLPPLPGWLLEMIFRKKQTRESFTLPEVIGDGERNVTLFQLASSLRAKGLTPDEILATLEAANSRCVPPKPRVELVSIAKSASRYPPGEATGPTPPRRGQDSPVTEEVVW